MRGSNFLEEATKRPVDAIRFRVFVAGTTTTHSKPFSGTGTLYFASNLTSLFPDGVAWLGLRTCRSRLPRLSLEDLSLNAKHIENLFADPNGFIPENQIAAPWVHVLPR